MHNANINDCVWFIRSNLIPDRSRMNAATEKVTQITIPRILRSNIALFDDFTIGSDVKTVEPGFFSGINGSLM